MTAAQHVDAVVLGTGQAVELLALAPLGEAGCRAAVVGRAAVGGSSMNVGRTPNESVVARVSGVSCRRRDSG